jgi:hypothetical protein
MEHSKRAKQGLTNELKAQLGFLEKDLVHEKASLAKAKSYLKWNLPGTKGMVKRHQSGVNQTLRQLRELKIRIRKRQKNGECFKIL